MFLADGTLVGAEQPALQQRHDPMYPRQEMFAFGAAALYPPVVGIALQSKIGSQPIGPNGTPRLDGLSDKSVETGLGQIGDTTQADAPNARAIFFCCHENQSLLVCQPADHPLFFAAPVSLVHLYCPVQSIPARPDHSPSQFVQQGPGRLVAAESQCSLQTQSTHSILLAGDMPNGPEPNGERQMTVLENRARCYRDLVTAIRAQPQAPAGRPSPFSAAARTDETLEPPQGKQVLPTRLFVDEPFFQFQDRARIVFGHEDLYYTLNPATIDSDY